MEATSELSIRIKADKENNVLHVTDTGIGMSSDDLINQLGTIAKSGTSEFLQKLQVSILYSLFMLRFLHMYGCIRNYFLM